MKQEGEAQEGPAQQERGLNGGQEPEGVRPGCRINDTWKHHEATAWRKLAPVVFNLSERQTPRGHVSRRLAPPPDALIQWVWGSRGIYILRVFPRDADAAGPRTTP